MTFKSIGQMPQPQNQPSPSKGGDQRGEIISSGSHGSSPEIVKRMVAHRPEDLDKKAVLRASSHNVKLMVRYECRYPRAENGERLPSYQVAMNCSVFGLEDDVQKTLADLRKYETPADRRTIEGWLAELSVIVAKRQDDAFSDNLRAEAYSSRLAQYPADVVFYALFKRTWKFWPTWSELQKVCDNKAGPRRHMISALERGPEQTEPERKPPTAEERERMRLMIEERFPSVPQAWRDAAIREVNK